MESLSHGTDNVEIKSNPVVQVDYTPGLNNPLDF